MRGLTPFVFLVALLSCLMPMSLLADDKTVAQMQFDDESSAVPSAAPALGQARALSDADVSLALPAPVKGDLTVALWVYFDQVGGTVPLITCDAGEIAIRTPPGKRNASPQFTAGEAPEASFRHRALSGRWYHVAAIFHADETAELLINGYPAGQAKRSRRSGSVSRVQVGGTGFIGKVDEIAVYDRALSADELQSHFRAVVRSLPTRETATVAHRGDNAYAPENTRISYVQAVEKGSPIVEIDLRLTRDNHLVLMHDETIDRTTSGRGKVLNWTLAELEKLDAGSWKSRKFRNEPVASMDAVAKVCQGKTIMMLDLKCTGLGSAIADWMKRDAVAADQVILAPWKDEEGIALRQYLPDVPMIRLTSSVPDDFDDAYFQRMKQIGFSGFSVNWTKLPKRFVEAAQRHGMKVYAWTVNAPSDVAGAVLAGVDGIVTDDPAATMKKVNELKATAQE